MKEYRLKYLDEELFRFKDIDREIAIRRIEITSRESTEENVGGSRSSFISKSTEALAIKLADDVVLKNITNFKETVNRMKQELTDDQLEIFNLRWQEPCHSWDMVARKTGESLATIYRKRRKILEKYEKFLKIH